MKIFWEVFKIFLFFFFYFLEIENFYCFRLFSNFFWKIFKTKLSSLTDINLVLWGSLVEDVVLLVPIRSPRPNSDPVLIEARAYKKKKSEKKNRSPVLIVARGYYFFNTRNMNVCMPEACGLINALDGFRRWWDFMFTTGTQDFFWSAVILITQKLGIFFYFSSRKTWKFDFFSWKK